MYLDKALHQIHFYMPLPFILNKQPGLFQRSKNDVEALKLCSNDDKFRRQAKDLNGRLKEREFSHEGISDIL